MVDGVVWMPEAAQWMECDRADGLRTAAHERRLRLPA